MVKVTKEEVMKKLLVLMLVLGLVSAANAVLSISVNGSDPGAEITIGSSDSIVVDISSDNGTSYGTWMYIYDGDRALSNPATTQGDISGYVGAHYANYDYYYVTIASSTGNLVAGTGFVFDYLAIGTNDVLIELYDQSGATLVDSLVIHQPEPMTIALLGLGGLFLRRRKK